jgi:hypothetical protein
LTVEEWQEVRVRMPERVFGVLARSLPISGALAGADAPHLAGGSERSSDQPGSHQRPVLTERTGLGAEALDKTRALRDQVKKLIVGNRDDRVDRSRKVCQPLLGGEWMRLNEPKPT